MHVCNILLGPSSPLTDTYGAAYHFGRKVLAISKLATKAAIAECMLKHGLTEFAVHRPPTAPTVGHRKGRPAEDLHFKVAAWRGEDDEWNIPSYPHGPSPGEMRDTLHAHVLQTSPELLMSEVDRVVRRMGGLTIYICPGSPDFDPMENLWANVKCPIARTWRPKRKLKEIRQRLAEYFRNPSRHAELVGKVVEIAYTEASKVLKDFAELPGNDIRKLSKVLSEDARADIFAAVPHPSVSTEVVSVAQSGGEGVGDDDSAVAAMQCD